MSAERVTFSKWRKWVYLAHERFYCTHCYAVGRMYGETRRASWRESRECHIDALARLRARRKVNR